MVWIGMRVKVRHDYRCPSREGSLVGGGQAVRAKLGATDEGQALQRWINSNPPGEVARCSILKKVLGPRPAQWAKCPDRLVRPSYGSTIFQVEIL